MIRYTREIEALFSQYEQIHLTEKEIFGRCIDLVKIHNLSRDYMFDLNDVLFNHGYSFQFDVPGLERIKFDNKTYWDLAANVGKSLEKTKELITYLKGVYDFRLALASLHMFKCKFLLTLDLLPNDNEFINNHISLNLRDLLFLARQEDYDAYGLILNMLPEIGLQDSTLAYMLFRLDVEYLLWSIEQVDKNNGYIKVNTLKVALNLAPKCYFERNNKLYYNEKFSKCTQEYIKLIDKEKIKKVKEQWGLEGYPIDGTGYQVLYKLL